MSASNSPYPVQDFRQVTFTLSNDLRRLQGYAETLALVDVARQVEEIRQRIENHTFSIAVVGEFKRGKSTFINALLGQEILPADILPTSATLNRVTFGREPTVRLFFKSQPNEPERVAEITIDQLADYVTKLTPEAETIAATVREAVVYYPVPYCRIHNMDIIDTPGLSDEAALTEVTLSVLPRVDAAILVIMATAPFSDSEGAFLEQLLAQGLGRVIFAVTALDRIKRLEDRQRVTQSVVERIEKRICQYAEAQYGLDTAEYQQYLKRVGRPRVFGLSGYQALEAKRTNNSDLLRESYFIEFEDELKRFLTEESDALALRSRTAQINTAGQEIVKAIQTQIERLAAQQKAYQITQAIATALIETLQQLGKAELRHLTEAQDRLKDKTRTLATQRPLAAQGAMAKLQSSLQGAFGSLLRIPTEIQNTLKQEIVRLHPFAITFDRVIAHVELLAIQLTSDETGDNHAGPKPAAASLLAKLGGQVGFDQPVNGATPALIESVTVEEIKKQLESSRIGLYLDEIFDRLKWPIDEALSQAQEWLLNLRTQGERLNVSTEHQLRQLQAMQAEVEAIRRQAQELSHQIIVKSYTT